MDKTERLSFLDSDVVYSETEIPEVIVDLEVRNGILITHKADDTEEDSGTWYGKSGVQIKEISLTPDDQIMTVLTNDAKYITPRTKWDVNIPSNLRGTGQIQPPSAFPHLFNDTPTDFYDEENDLLYMLGKAPKCSVLTALRLVTLTGITITASSQWSATYPLYSAFNRKVDFVSDGILGAGPLTITFEFPVDKPAEIKGYLYQNLRADYTTSSYIIEYQAPGSATWLALDTRTPGMALNTVIYAEPVIVKAIRWRSLSHINAAGVGRLDWLVGKHGNTAIAKPLNFPVSHFNVTQTEDEILVEPNRLTATVNDDVVFTLANYHHLLNVPTAGQRTLFKANVMNVVPWNVVKVDTSVAADELPLIKLKRGRWYYKYAMALVNTGKFRVYLSIGGTPYPLSDVMTGVTQLTTSRAVVVQDEGIIEIPEDTTTFLVVEQEGSGGLSKVEVDNQNAELELWWLDEELTPIVAPVVPSVGLKPARFKHLEGTFANGNGSALFTSSLAETTLWSSPTNYLVLSVATHFRIWRCTISGGSVSNAQLKISKLDKGAYVLAGAHIPLVKVGHNEWELMTYTLTPGVYRFDQIAERKDSAWFIEERNKPTELEFGDVNIRVTLPMVSASESGQTVSASSALSASYAGFYAFTATPSGGGWISSTETDFEASLSRANLPMTTPTSNGQVLSASSSYGAAYTPLYAFKAAATTEGWVSANRAATEASPHWLGIELAAPATVDEYRLTNRTTTANTVIPPKDWQLQYSDNGADWLVAHTVVNDPGKNLGEVRHFTIGAAITAKHWRLNITASWPGFQTGSFVGVALFELLRNKTASTEWLRVDFDSPQGFNHYALTNRLSADDNTTHSPQDWQLQGKVNGGSWEVLHEVVGDTRNTNGLVRDYSLPAVVRYDSVRLAITKKNPGTGAEADNKYTCVQNFKLTRTENTINADWL